MEYNITITKSEEKQLKDIVLKEYIKKYDIESFEETYSNYKNIKEFEAIGNINDKEYKGFFNEKVHYLMRLIAQYHINQALKALKYDTLNDENLKSDDEGNIGTPGRIAKLWIGSKLDSDNLSELADGRWTKKPRLAAFPIERKKVTGSFETDDNDIVKFKTKDGEIYILETTPVGDRTESALRKENTNNVFLIDIDNKDYNIEELREKNNSYHLDKNLLIKQGELTIAMIDNKKREIVKKAIFNLGLGSTCSHHFLPYFIAGKETNSKIVIAYKAYKDNIGISKITKVVKWLAKRPSLQEELTQKIAEELKKVTGSEDVFVGMYSMLHTCEVTRGSSTETSTTTEHAEGIFQNDEILRGNIYNKG